MVVPLRPDREWESTREWYKRALRTVAPQWADMLVASSTKYLGLIVGPGATPDEQWAGAWQKHDRRVSELAAGRCAPSAARDHYAVYIRPVLGYTAQVLQEPVDLAHKEDVTLQRLWRFPLRALPRGAGGLMRRLGLPVPADCGAFLRRCRGAAANRHADLVRRLSSELGRARRADGTLASMAAGSPAHSAEQWLSPSFADVLHDALREGEREQARPPEARGERRVRRRAKRRHQGDPPS